MEVAGVLRCIGCECCSIGCLIASLLALKVEGDKRVQNKICLRPVTLLASTLTLAGAHPKRRGCGKNEWKFKSSGRGYYIGKVRALLNMKSSLGLPL